MCPVDIEEGIVPVGEIHLRAVKSPSGSLDNLKLGDELSLSCDSTAAEIYYTTDGTEPTILHGMRYDASTTKLLLESWCPFIRAMAVLKGHLPRTFISARLFVPGFRDVLISTAIFIQRWYKRWKAKRNQDEAARALLAIDEVIPDDNDAEADANTGTDTDTDSDDLANSEQMSPRSAANRRLRPKSAKFKKSRTPSNISDVADLQETHASPAGDCFEPASEATDTPVNNSEVVDEDILQVTETKEPEAENTKQAADASDAPSNDTEITRDKELEDAAIVNQAERTNSANLTKTHTPSNTHHETDLLEEANEEGLSFPSLDHTPQQLEERWLNILGLSCSNLPKMSAKAQTDSYVVVDCCSIRNQTQTLWNRDSPSWTPRKCPTFMILTKEDDEINVRNIL